MNISLHLWKHWGSFQLLLPLCKDSLTQMYMLSSALEMTLFARHLL